MANLTINNLALSGLVDTLSAAAGGGDAVQAVGEAQDTWIEVANGGGSSINVTIAKKSGVSTVTVPGLGPTTVSDMVVAVANGARNKIGPFPAHYIQADGSVSIAYSGVTSVTVGAFRCRRID